MGILDALNDFVKEIDFAKHPFAEEDMSFRYTYALGVTIAAYVDDIIEESEKEKLYSLYKSLNIVDKEESLHSEGKNPTRETFQLLTESITTLEQKTVFLLDASKLLKSNSKDEETFFNALFKMFKISPMQKEKYQKIKDSIFKYDKFIDIEENLMKEINDTDFVYKLIIYFFNDQVDDFINELDEQLEAGKFHELTEKLNQVTGEIWELKGFILSKEEEIYQLNKESNKIIPANSYNFVSRVVNNSLAHNLEKNISHEQKMQKIESQIKANKFKELALVKERAELEKILEVELKPIFEKRELLVKYME